MTFEIDDAESGSRETPRDEIARLEREIEALAETAERCRKTMRAARIAIMAGGVGLVVAMTGIIALDPTVWIMAVAAAIGGIVMLGSTAATARQTAAAIAKAEAQRAGLIGGIPLRDVQQINPDVAAWGRNG
jgi:Flp pilus assembly protein TadB